ncbi:MAG: HNH endonuclease [Rhodobacteraceae bacterium]|nr:HNH endonuclease [Paracoccaceae bacterium]
MAVKPLPDIDTLHQLLRYEPETGKLYWKPRYSSDETHQKQLNRWNGARAGKEAFTAVAVNGYKQGRINSKTFYAHRVIMAMVDGEWPPQDVDHINRDRTDNRLCNLRSVTRSENMHNTKTPSHNTSGHVGVSWYKSECRWVARVWANGQTIHLGRFTRKADAIAARKTAEAEHGFHKNHGRDTSINEDM